eukprot:TRINITY_DN16513_c0_g1_i1.p2 TRINITY_DN16513_c0_g1~~TRINITY_DN16513_c0_g1_i1.p2  ORF type:complete len:131 (-),score=23.07 TRINITY_DN16513_c0_g1_i1:505-897(-)
MWFVDILKVLAENKLKEGQFREYPKELLKKIACVKEYTGLERNVQISNINCKWTIELHRILPFEKIAPISNDKLVHILNIIHKESKIKLPPAVAIIANVSLRKNPFISKEPLQISSAPTPINCKTHCLTS